MELVGAFVGNNVPDSFVDNANDVEIVPIVSIDDCVDGTSLVWKFVGCDVVGIVLGLKIGSTVVAAEVVNVGSPVSGLDVVGLEVMRAAVIGEDVVGELVVGETVVGLLVVALLLVGLAGVGSEVVELALFVTVVGSKVVGVGVIG